MNILVTRHYFQSWYIKSMMQKLSFIYQLCMFYFRQYLFKNQCVGMYPCFFFFCSIVKQLQCNCYIGLGVQSEAAKKLIEFCQENTLVIANTQFQQHKRRLYTLTSPEGKHQNQIDYILCSQRWRSSIQSAKSRLETDCGSDHECLIAKFRLKLKKVG